MNEQLTEAEILLKRILVQTQEVKEDIDNLSFKKLIDSSKEYIKKLLDIEYSLESQSDIYSDIKGKIDVFGGAIVRTITHLKGSNFILRDNAELISKTKELQLSLPSIYRTLNKLNEAQLSHQNEILSGNLKSKDIQKELVESKKNEFKITKELENIEQTRNILETEKQGTIGVGSGKIKAELQNRINALGDIHDELTAQKGVNQEISSELEKQYRNTKRIEKSIPVFGKALEGLKKIPLLGEILDVDEAAQAMKSVTADGGGMVKSMSAGIKALGPSIKAAFGPLLAIMIVVKAVQAFKDIMFDADTRVTNIAKNLNISKDQASEVLNSFRLMVDKQKELTLIQEGNQLTRNDLIESQQTINNLLGTSIDFSTSLGVKGEYIVTQFANAVKYLKLSEKEQRGLLGLSAAYGKDLDSVQSTILGTTRLRKVESGILVDERQILSDVLETSNSIKLSIKGGVSQLTLAATKAKELGLSLSQIDKIADTFLDFESSISSELEAELLTGREINLEQERYYALTNDIEGLTKEIGQNQALINSFSNSNRITQSAIASSLGMSRDEMADMINNQQNLNKLKSHFQAIDEKTLKNLVKTNQLRGDEVKRIRDDKATVQDYYRLAKGNQESLVGLLGQQSLAALESTDSQQKFNESLDQAKQLFSNFVSAGYLDDLAKSIVKFTTFLVGDQATIRESKEIQKSDDFKNTSTEIQERIITNTKQLEHLQKEYPNLGHFAIKRLQRQIREDVEIVKNKTLTEPPAEDFISRPGMPVQRFRKDDIIIGGTRLADQEGAKLTNNYNQDNTELIKEFKSMKDILNKILHKESAVYLDSYKVGTGINMGTYKSTS